MENEAIPRPDDPSDSALSEVQMREKYKPVFVPSFIVKERISFFHASYVFPYQTSVQMSDGHTLVVKMEVEEFAKLYES